jgi:hypothetical protein
MLTAVVCSGGKRPPGLEGPVGADARGAGFVCGGGEASSNWAPVSRNPTREGWVGLRINLGEATLCGKDESAVTPGQTANGRVA